MYSVIYFGVLFLAKVLDNALSTTKTILIQRSRWLLAGIAVMLSDFIYFWLTKRIVAAEMLIYQQVHKYDLDVLGLILEQIEYADSSNIKKQLAKKAINLQNTFVVIEKTIKKIYEEEDLVFDGHKNKYLC